MCRAIFFYLLEMLSNYFYYVIEFIGAIPTCVSILEKVPEAIAMGKAHLSIDYFAPVQKFFFCLIVFPDV